MRHVIQTVIQRRVASNELFTAYDVSREVQAEAKKGNLPFVRHLDLKNEIHDEMQMHMSNGSYVRTLCDVGAPTPAFVYHPTTVPASNYRNATPAIVGASSTTAVATDDSDDDDDSDDNNADRMRNTSNSTHGRVVDARKTLTVPALLVAMVGMAPFDEAVAYYTDYNNKKVLAVAPAAEAPATARLLTTYTVDKDRNIRVTQAQLSHLGTVESDDQYDFEAQGTTIYIIKR